MEQAKVVAIYADGGVIKKNPSVIGGTWAWCGVDADGNRVIGEGGVVAAPSGRTISNNHMEQIALVKAMEAMPEGWSGMVYSDSQVALGRVFLNWATNNLPKNIIERTNAARLRLGKLQWRLLQGHPTKAELATGWGKKRDLPVSIHNVWCDEECTRQAKTYLAQQEAANGASQSYQPGAQAAHAGCV
jgi:ribonuclease HI